MQRFSFRGAVLTGVTTAAAFAAVMLGAGSASAAAWPDGAWAGSGTAAATVTSDGTASNPVFDYATNGHSGTWTFQATAKTARSQPVAYRYKGYHAWFQVKVGLQQFVIHNGVETDTTLQGNTVAVNCCSAPSGGFDYSGTATFNLQPNDQYGFKMSGSNADSDARLLGTLSLSIPAPPMTITNPGTRSGTVGTASSVQLAASGGVGPFTWSATGLPGGVSMNSSTGLISGTPIAAGSFTVTVTATDAATPTHATASQTFTWNIAAGGCASAGQKVVNGGFENGDAPWSTGPGVLGNTSGAASGQTAHSGASFAWLDGYATTHTDTLQQIVTLPAGCTNYLFSFFLHIDSGETSTTTQFDKLTIQANTTTVAVFSNLNKATGYTQHTFDLKAFAGQTVTLKFTGTEDSSQQTSFVIDDVAINVS